MLPRILVVAVPALAAGLIGCGGPLPGSTGYLLLDAQARSAGFYFALPGWSGSPVMPIRVEATDAVSLGGPGGQRRLMLRPGALGYIQGRDGELSWSRLDADVRSDELRIDGRDTAARQLADKLGAEVAPGPDGTWRLIGTELLDRGAFLDPPEGVFEAIPELMQPSPTVWSEMQLGSSAAAISGSSEGHAPGAGAEALVGLYAADAQWLLLNAEGGYSLEGCGEPPIEGRYTREGETIVLTPKHGLPRVLALSPDGSMRAADGEPFTLMMEEK